MVPRDRLGSQTLCPYRVLPWNPRPGGRPGYFINVLSPVLTRHSILGSHPLQLTTGLVIKSVTTSPTLAGERMLFILWKVLGKMCFS